LVLEGVSLYLGESMFYSFMSAKEEKRREGKKEESWLKKRHKDILWYFSYITRKI
jgi:hypothetical protein